MHSTKLVYNKKIRSVWSNRKRKRYYCLNDVIKVLTDVKDAKNYLKGMRKRNAELAKNWNKLVKSYEMDTPGGRQIVKCTDALGLMLIMKNMRSSVKTELFRRWLIRK
jgi:hypothetical protein